MQGIILILTALSLNSAATECKNEIELTIDPPLQGEIKIYPIEDRFKKSLKLIFPIDCKTRKLIKPKNTREFIELLDAAVTTQFRRGLLSGNDFSRTSTGYKPELISKFSNLIEKLYKEDVEKICDQAKGDCKEIIFERWRDYYLKFDTDEFDKLNPDDFDPNA